MVPRARQARLLQEVRMRRFGLVAFDRQTAVTVLSAILAALLVTACGPAAPVGPVGFSLDYATGSIPPPYNYRYTIDVVFDDAGAQVVYELEYLHRAKMSEEELRELGYSTRDDIRWRGGFDAEVADRWRDVARNGRLTGSAEPAPGADSMLVRVSDGGEAFRAGVPLDRGPWQDIAREVDRAARQELDHERPTP